MMSPAGGRAMLFTSTDVEAGDELVWDYGRDPRCTSALHPRGPGWLRRPAHTLTTPPSPHPAPGRQFWRGRAAPL